MWHNLTECGGGHEAAPYQYEEALMAHALDLVKPVSDDPYKTEAPNSKEDSEISWLIGVILCSFYCLATAAVLLGLFCLGIGQDSCMAGGIPDQCLNYNLGILIAAGFFVLVAFVSPFWRRLPKDKKGQS